MVSVREGGNIELVCLVSDGKPRPPILWSRTEKDLLMPSGKTIVETPDGRLRLKNVSRDMMGLYRCQTAPYNGLNIKRREAQVQLNVQCKCGSDYVLPTSLRSTYNNIQHHCLHQAAEGWGYLLKVPVPSLAERFGVLKSRLVTTALKCYYCCILSITKIRQNIQKMNDPRAKVAANSNSRSNVRKQKHRTSEVEYVQCSVMCKIK